MSIATSFRITVTAACGLLAAIAFSASAMAGNGCYTPAQSEAEKAIRFHNELMVIGLTCQGLMPEKALFSNYKSFTSKHQTNLMAWEKLLIQAMGSQPSFDSFRTRIANESAQRAASITPEQYCATHANMIAEAMAISTAELQQHVSRTSLAQASSRPLCGGKPADPTVSASLNPPPSPKN